MNTVSVVISVLAFLIPAIIALFQWSKSVNVKKAEIINDIIDKLYKEDYFINPDIDCFTYLNSLDVSDNEIVKDDDLWNYDEHYFSELGMYLIPKLEKTLYYYSYICYLKHKNLIDVSEFLFFRGFFSRWGLCGITKKYLKYLAMVDDDSFMFASYKYFYLYLIEEGFIDQIMSDDVKI